MQQECLKCGVFCNDSSIEFIDNTYKMHGDPTEISLLISSIKAKINNKELLTKNKRIDTLRFESERQYMAVLIQMQNGEKRLYGQQNRLK